MAMPWLGFLQMSIAHYMNICPYINIWRRVIYSSHMCAGHLLICEMPLLDLFLHVVFLFYILLSDVQTLYILVTNSHSANTFSPVFGLSLLSFYVCL